MKFSADFVVNVSIQFVDGLIKVKGNKLHDSGDLYRLIYTCTKLLITCQRPVGATNWFIATFDLRFIVIPEILIPRTTCYLGQQEYLHNFLAE